MAGTNFYYLVSVIAEVILAIHIINIIFYKVKGTNLIGHPVKPGMIGYKKFEGYVSLKGLLLTALISIALTVNLGFSIKKVLGEGSQAEARWFLFRNFYPEILLNIVQIFF